MEMNDLISIIIPVYNMEKRIARCLKTVTEQTYHNLEIIIVNDGSTDNSLKICEEFSKKDNRIILVDKANGGVSSARNAALERSTGKYLAFIDSDDYIASNYIQELYTALIENNADIVECGATVFNEVTGESTQLLPRFSTQNNTEEIVTAFCRNEGISDFLWNKLYKRDLFNGVYFSNLKCSEDFEVLCYILEKCSMVVSINAKLYYYMRNDMCLGLSPLSEKKLDVIKARENIYNYYCSIGAKKWAYMIAVQILSQAIVLYSQIDSSTPNKQKYKNYLLGKFKEYYPIALLEKHSLKKDLLRLVKFKTFGVFPKFVSKYFS